MRILQANRRQLFRAALLALAASLALPAAAAAGLPPGAQVPALAARAAPPALYDEGDWLERFYGARGDAPAWTGAKAAQAASAQALLANAAEHGLVAADYAADGEAPHADAHLTLAVLRYLADLHAGRLRAGTPPAPAALLRQFDPVAALQAALANGSLAAAADAAAPQLALYRRLKAALALYRDLALEPLAPLAPLPARAKPVEPGAAYPGAPALRARLRLFGDLAAGGADEGDATYTPALAQAVRRFQDRHGLAPDGRLGRQTLAALAVPPAVRVRQIELAMERLRWLPRPPAGPAIAINVPAYRLWAVRHAASGGAPALAMRVIVGKAALHQTPLLTDAIRFVEFNPYWNVPPSIALAEIVPALARNPGYLAGNDMEVVDRRGQAVAASAGAAIAGLRAGSLRVRQRPGPQNALGAVKFGMSNSMNIYLHSTPARTLFKAARRDFSHGCIRVEDPAALAAFVLEGLPEWTADDIAAAMAPGPNRTVRLPAPVPVIIFYATAMVDRDGRLLFPSDVYQLDAPLAEALARRSEALRARRQTPCQGAPGGC